MKRRGILSSCLLAFAFLITFSSTAHAGAVADVSAGEMSGYELLYSMNKDNFFNDAYDIDNSANFSVGDFARVGYYVKLGNDWAWASMDTFNTDPTMVGVPKQNSGIVETGTLVNNLNVESNKATPVTGATGIIEFWSTNYNANGGGAYGSDDGRYDWKDSGGGTGGGHGSFQVFSLNATLDAGETVFGITRNGGMGIGDQYGPGGGNAPDWTFGPKSGASGSRFLEIWVKPPIAGTLSSIIDGTWNTPATWELDGGGAGSGIQPTVDYATIVNGQTITVAANGTGNTLQIDSPIGHVQIDSGATLAIDRGVNIDQGSMNVDGTLSASRIDVAAPGTLSVPGTINTPEVNTAGTTTLTGGGAVGSLNVTGGETTLGTPTINNVSVSGGSLKVGSPLAVTDFTMTGGSVSTDGSDISASGTLALQGGTINSSGTVNIAPTGAGVTKVSNNPDINVNGGHLTIDVPVQAGVLPGTLGYWSMDGNADDSSGNNYHGVRSGGSYSTNVPANIGGGNSVNLNGNGYIVVETPGNSAFDLDSMSVAFWGKEWPDGQWEPYISKRGESGQGWQVRRNRSNGDRMSFTLRGTGNDDWSAVVPGDLNEWHHYVATYGDGFRRLYQDGVLVGQESRTGNVNDTGSALVFGARDNSGNASNPPNIGNYSSVWLDEIFILNRPISASEVSDLYNNNLPPGLATFGHLYMAEDSQLTLAGAGEALFQGITAGDNTTINGNVTAAGQVSVGNSPGTLNINGDYTQGAGSTYQWEVNSGASDLISATGHVDASAVWNLEVTPLDHSLNMNGAVLMSGGTATGPAASTNVTLADNVYADLYDVSGATVGVSGSDIVLSGVAVNPNVTTSQANGDWNPSGNWNNGTPSNSLVAVVDGETITVGTSNGTAKSVAVTAGNLNVPVGRTLTSDQHVRVGDTATLSVAGNVTSTGGEVKIHSGGTLHLDNGGTVTASRIDLQSGGMLRSTGTQTLPASVSADPNSTIHVQNGTLSVNATPQLSVTNNLISHWDASAITGLTAGATVDTWINIAPGGPTATRSNGTPTYETDAIHGMPTVRFDSNANNKGEYFSFSRLSDIKSAFWVINDDSPSRNDHFLLGDSGSYHFHRGGGGQIWDGNNTSGNIRNGITKLDGVVIDGTTTVLTEGDDIWHLISMRTNGNSVQSNQITQDRTYHGSWEGDIAEILLYSSVLSDAEEEAVGAYLAAKYGLPGYVGGPSSEFGYLQVDTGATLLNTGTKGLSFEGISGGGIVNSDVVARSLISPGDSIGMLTVNGDLELSSGVVYAWEMSSAGTAGVDYDTVSIAGGDLTLSDWVLQIANTEANAEETDMFYLLTGYDALTDGLGNWAIDDSLLDPELWDASGAYIGIDDDGLGMDGIFLSGLIAMGAVPEPSTFVLAALSLFGLAFFGWRKRK